MAGNRTLDLTIRIAGKMDKSLLAAINGTQSRISDLSRSVSRAGTMGLAAMGALATGTVAAIASCTKEATTFENQMADVVKYVDGLADATGKISEKVWAVGEGGNGQTYAQNYAAMKDAILDLSTQIPYTAEDLTRLAAAAGQSGKSMDEITGGFLKDAAMWGKATDISADQAGDWAAKWEVAFHMNHDQIMELADQINYLGANNATTAAEIASVVNDAANLGQVAGIDPDATAAIGTAMLAMGVDAGKVGTSVKRIYTNISKGSSATKAMKEQWEELGFTAEGVAASMQKDGVGTMQKIFSAIDQLPEERQVAALSTLFGQWAIEGGAKIVGNLDYYAGVMESIKNPANYTGSMAREFQIKADTPEAVKQMRDSAWSQLKIGFGESFLPVQKELDIAMRDLFVTLHENMPQLSQLGGTLAELASGGIRTLGEALQTALPYVQRALDYVANNGPQVVKILGGMAGTFAAMKFAPGIEGLIGGAGNLLLGTKSGAGNYATRTGGLAGMASSLWNGGTGRGPLLRLWRSGAGQRIFADPERHGIQPLVRERNSRDHRPAERRSGNAGAFERLPGRGRRHKELYRREWDRPVFRKRGVLHGESPEYDRNIWSGKRNCGCNRANPVGDCANYRADRFGQQRKSQGSKHRRIRNHKRKRTCAKGRKLRAGTGGVWTGWKSSKLCAGARTGEYGERGGWLAWKRNPRWRWRAGEHVGTDGLRFRRAAVRGASNRGRCLQHHCRGKHPGRPPGGYTRHCRQCVRRKGAGCL